MKKYLIIIFLLIAVAIGAYFFLFGKKDVCKNVIPEDAKAVLVIDAKQALKQMDFSISDIFKALKRAYVWICLCRQLCVWRFCVK